MSSPEIHRSVNNQTLANSHFSCSGSHRNHSHKKPSSSRNFVGNRRICSKSDSNLIEHAWSCSPYYKGLVDQSLAICKTAQPQQESSSSDYNQNRHFGNVPLASPECSRYYKGLTDYTLAVSSKQLASGGSYHDEFDYSYHIVGSLPRECSVYYKGLLDYTLALCDLERASRGSSAYPGVDTNPNFTNIVPLNSLTLCFTGLNPEPGYSSSAQGKTDDDLGFVVREKPLGERVSEPCMVGRAEEETTDKPLRESISVSKQEKYTWENKEKALELKESDVDASNADGDDTASSTEMVSPLVIASAFSKPSATATATPGDIEAALSQLVNENYVSSGQAAELKSFLNAHPSMFIPVSAMRNLRHLGWAYSCLLDLLPLISRCKELDITDDEGNKLLEVLDDMQSFPFDKYWVKAADKYVTSVLVFVKDHRPALSEAYEQIEVARKEVLVIQEEITAKKAVAEAHLERIKKEIEALSLKMMAALAMEATATEIKEDLMKTIPAPFI
ncbi:hypothetical protein L6164_000259 [Bauhinia variegata]|uniref:Uncharacterized protein n=1 Tax=Bauhinia variegata TaxID=167791 RepID=A0ACB9Q6K7_BAUVA|nr:hypothetical protein L6164_000259 [Bauhinia variegata]